MDAELPKLTRADIERFVSVIRWNSDGSAIIECPSGKPHHLEGSPPKLWITPIPHCYCFHESCRQDVAELNSELAGMAQSFDIEEAKESPEAKALRQRLARLQRTAMAMPLPFRERSVSDWERLSPVDLSEFPVETQFSAFVGMLYPPDALIWTGEKYESGERATLNFRTAEEWAKRGDPYGQLISLFSFQSSVKITGQRQRKFVERRLFDVLESDTVDLPAFSRVVQWREKFTKLRALVLTGGKLDGSLTSVHAFFDPARWPMPKGQPPGSKEFVCEGKRFYVESPSIEHIEMRERDHEELMERWGRPPRKAPYPWKGSRQRKERWIEELIAPRRKQKNGHRVTELGLRWRSAFLKLREKRRAGEEAYRAWATKHLELNAILTGMGCDRAMLNSNLTARCPGVERLADDGTASGRFQRLIYLNPCNYERKYHT